MIRFIKGEYLFYDNGAMVIETKAGLGLRVNVPSTSSLLTAREGDEVSVYTHFHMKDSEMSLFGFADAEGLKLFEQLITVNGVGPKGGLSIMSLGTPNQIKASIANKDAAAITKAHGIGKKAAERIILELASKISVDPFGNDEIDLIEQPVATSATGARAEAILALTTLGYTKKEAEDAIASVPDEGIGAEEYIKKALKYLL